MQAWWGFHSPTLYARACVTTFWVDWMQVAVGSPWCAE